MPERQMEHAVLCRLHAIEGDRREKRRGGMPRGGEKAKSTAFADGYAWIGTSAAQPMDVRVAAWPGPAVWCDAQAIAAH